MQIAKMFAALGFKVDVTELTVFETKLREVRKSSANFARNLKYVDRNLKDVKKSLKGVNDAMDSSATKRANKSLSGSFARMANQIERAKKGTTEINAASTALIPRLDELRGRVWKGSNAWEKYTRNIMAAKEQTRQFRDRLRELRYNYHDVVVNIREVRTRTGGAGNGAGGVGAGAGSGAGAFAAGGLAGRALSFLKPLSPTGVMLGGGLGAGYAVKEIISSGREMQKMRNVLLSVSRDTEDFNRNLQYVEKTSNYLGTNVNEFGLSFSKIFASAKNDLKTSQIQEFFKQIQEYSVTLQLSADDQKGVGKAIGQMFSKDRVMAEEARGQLAERVPAAMKLLEQAARNAGIEFKSFDDAMKQGKLTSSKVIPEFGKLLAIAARKNGALEAALKNSVTAQERFNNSIRKLNYELMASGLDKALADFFEMLTKIATFLMPLAKGLLEATIGLAKFTKKVFEAIREYPKLTAAIAAVVAILILKKKAAGATGASMDAMITRLILGFMNLGTMMKRVPLLLMLWGLYEFGRAFKQHLDGGDNWLTFLGERLVWAALKVDYLIERLKTLWAEATDFDVKMNLNTKQDMKDTGMWWLDNLGLKSLRNIGSEVKRWVNPSLSGTAPPTTAPTNAATNTTTKTLVLNLEGQAVLNGSNPSNRTVVPFNTQSLVIQH